MEICSPGSRIPLLIGRQMFRHVDPKFLLQVDSHVVAEDAAPVRVVDQGAVHLILPQVGRIRPAAGSNIGDVGMEYLV